MGAFDLAPANARAESPPGMEEIRMPADQHAPTPSWHGLNWVQGYLIVAAEDRAPARSLLTRLRASFEGKPDSAVASALGPQGAVDDVPHDIVAAVATGSHGNHLDVEDVLGVEDVDDLLRKWLLALALWTTRRLAESEGTSVSCATLAEQVPSAEWARDAEIFVTHIPPVEGVPGVRCSISPTFWQELVLRRHVRPAQTQNPPKRQPLR
jgi:hypothetical protein